MTEYGFPVFTLCSVVLDLLPLTQDVSGTQQPYPYQGGQGGSNLKSIFNLIITSYLTVILMVRWESIIDAELAYTSSL